MGTYSSGNAASWTAGDQEIMFGPRHIAPAFATPGGINALIHEAHLYSTALTQAEIQALTLTNNDDTDNDLLILNDGLTPAVGVITHLTGHVFTSSGLPVRNAFV